ncbi:hypothetical protein BJ165DRAFT_1509863 [Panaeolus papilionaceus]|nr:hypothetical protein BJ165DRAFT_1509863 [Panaeolus papilionaceus]
MISVIKGIIIASLSHLPPFIHLGPSTSSSNAGFCEYHHHHDEVFSETAQTWQIFIRVAST